MASKNTSKAPTGLAISRSGAQVFFSWKQGEQYSKQGMCVRIDYGPWISVANFGSGTATSNYLDFSLLGITAYEVGFTVRGQAKGKKWSAWAPEASLLMVAPNTPSVSLSYASEHESICSYSIETSDSDNKPFVDSTWQTVLIENCSTTDGNAVNWSYATSGTGAASRAWPIPETGWSKLDYSYTRWVRVKSNGWGGSSPWSYAHHTYAVPRKATNLEATYTNLPGSGYSISASWNSPNSVAHPIDKVTVQYIEDSPTVSYSIPTGQNKVVATVSPPENPSGSWNNIPDVSGTGGKRGILFNTQANLGVDKCVFFRVINKHDEHSMQSDTKFVQKGIAHLAKPTFNGEIIKTGNKWTIPVSRNSDVNSFVAIYCRTTEEPNLNQVIGIVPAGSSSVDVVLPEIEAGVGISLGLKSYVADYSPSGPPPSSSYTTAMNYTITNSAGFGMMSSEGINWDGGEVPLPPANVVVNKISDSVVQVGWDWTWGNASQAELSWADHEDAWESTSEPTTYIVRSRNVNRWNIAGLGVGTWYIRIRLIKETDDAIMYGTYCDTQTIKLSASPDTPALLLSTGVVSKTGTVTCYWAYVSNDGTLQQQADICEVTYSYEAVENPSSSANPMENAWYEKVGDNYTRTFDITVEQGKTYYRTTGDPTYGSPIKSTSTAQHIDIDVAEMGWQPNETHHLAVRVFSASGESSEGWSAPVPVTVANEVQVAIESHTLEPKTIEVGEGSAAISRTVISLTELPLTIRASGAGAGGKTTYIIERAQSYKMDRPDESYFDGYEGETIYLKTVDGEDSCVINEGDTELLGRFDDGAKYRFVVIAQDSYGQIAQTSTFFTGSYVAVEEPTGNPSENGYYELVGNDYILSEDTTVDDEKTYYVKETEDKFEIHWDHQAIIPTATVEKDEDRLVSFITPIKPEGWSDGDVCDIYRLSADLPELIISGGTFGEKYVDPYPTLGEFGGHRVVYRTVNGDYITEDNIPAWTDYMASDNPAYLHDRFGVVIDFDGQELILPYNVSISNSWNKDVSITKYLGGSVVGDWNPSVERTASTSMTIPLEVEPDSIETLRRLAEYAGVCHVRTPDGSSYAANVNVKDNREEKWVRRKANISLEITRVKSEGFDGMSYNDWVETEDANP